MLSAVMWTTAVTVTAAAKKAFPESSGAGVETPVMPAGWEESDETMVRVGYILDNALRLAQAAFMVNVLKVGNWEPVICWAVFTTQWCLYSLMRSNCYTTLKCI